MSYSNQPDHAALDRHVIGDYLLSLTGASVATSPSLASRSEHLQTLMNLTQSELERQWLTAIYDRRYRLPDTAQKLLPEIGSRPDFIYEMARVAIYVDGPHHKYPERQGRDHQFDDALLMAGWTPLRFAVDDVERWMETIAQHPSTFGSGP